MIVDASWLISFWLGYIRSHDVGGARHACTSRESAENILVQTMSGAIGSICDDVLINATEI